MKLKFFGMAEIEKIEFLQALELRRRARERSQFPVPDWIGHRRAVAFWWNIATIAEDRPILFSFVLTAISFCLVQLGARLLA